MEVQGHAHLSSSGQGLVTPTPDTLSGLPSHPVRWLDRLLNCVRSLSGRQLPSLAGALSFPQHDFSRRKFPFLHCFRSLIVSLRDTSVYLGLHFCQASDINTETKVMAVCSPQSPVVHSHVALWLSSLLVCTYGKGSGPAHLALSCVVVVPPPLGLVC